MTPSKPSTAPGRALRVFRGPALPLLLLVWAALASAGTAQAQRLLTRTYAEQQGLPSSTVYAVDQDSTGRMWFLTRSGVTTYDGERWTVPSQENLFRQRLYSHMVLDSRGQAWLAASWPSFGVLRVDDRGAHQVPPPDDAPVPPETYGADTLRIESLETAGGPRLILGSDSSGVFVWDGHSWTRYTREDGLPDDRVTALAAVGDRCFVGTADGLAVLGPQGVTALPEAMAGAPTTGVLALAGDGDGEGAALWIVGRDWVGRLVRGELRVVRRDLDLPLTPTRDLPQAAADGRGGLYLGSLVGLYYLDGETGEIEPLDEASGLVGEGATDFLLDRESNLWVTTLRGVSKIVSRHIVSYDRRHELFSDEVTAIERDGAGGMILGHPDGLTFFSDGVRGALDLDREGTASSGPGWILDLELGRSGRLWVADGPQGLAVLERDGPGGRFGETQWVPGSRDVDGGITTVQQDAEGRLWAGGPSGLYRVRDLRLQSAGPGVGIRRLVLDEDGTLYACSFGEGLYTRRGDRWEQARSAEGELSNQIYAVARSGDDLWVGSASGLLTATGDGRLVRPRRPALRIERPVYLLLTDPRGRLWIGTDYGVYRWDGTALKHFSGEDGLAGNEVNRAAAHVDDRGRVWIGTTGGLSRFDDRFGRDKVPPPRVSFLEVETGTAVHPLTGSLRVGPYENTLVFRARAISFVDEERVHYRAHLEGLDRGWTESVGSTRFESRFRSLPSGTYRFELQARSENSGWSPVARTPEIRVVPPFWRRAWFYVLAAALAIGAIFGASRLVEQRRHAKVLEAEVERRTAQLVRSQKLESLGVLAGGIAHDFNNILTVIRGYVSLVQSSPVLGREEREHLDLAERALHRARELTARLLTFGRGGAPSTGPVDLPELVRETCQFASRGSNVVCRFELGPEMWPAEADPGQLSQVLGNLTLNAVQAMPDGGRITIRAENVKGDPPEGLGLAAGRYVHLVIEDDGPGMRPEDLPQIFDPFFTTKEEGSGLGLSTAYSIVKGHGGELSVRSEPEGGACFDLYLPAASRSPSRPAEARPGTGLERAAGARILVLDDQESVLSVLSKMLRRLGYEVETAAHGEEALERYRSARASGRRFDLAILDLTIPGGLGGVETLRRLRRIDPDVVAVASSGYAQDPVLASPEEYGFAAVLPKPYTLHALSEMLRETLPGTHSAAPPEAPPPTRPTPG